MSVLQRFMFIQKKYKDSCHLFYHIYIYCIIRGEEFFLIKYNSLCFLSCYLLDIYHFMLCWYYLFINYVFKNGKINQMIIYVSYIW